VRTVEPPTWQKAVVDADFLTPEALPPVTAIAAAGAMQSDDGQVPALAEIPDVEVFLLDDGAVGGLMRTGMPPPYGAPVDLTAGKPTPYKGGISTLFSFRKAICFAAPCVHPRAPCGPSRSLAAEPGSLPSG